MKRPGKKLAVLVPTWMFGYGNEEDIAGAAVEGMGAKRRLCSIGGMLLTLK
jgi:hypothetical protein